MALSWKFLSRKFDMVFDIIRHPSPSMLDYSSHATVDEQEHEGGRAGAGWRGAKRLSGGPLGNNAFHDVIRIHVPST